MKHLLTSALAALPAFIVFFVACAVAYYSWSGTDSIEIDNAPQRAAAIFAILMPFLYIVGVVAIWLLVSALDGLRLLTRRALVLTAILTSVSFGLFTAFNAPFGLRDVLLSLCTFTSLAAIFQIPTCYLWWYCYTKRESAQVNTSSV